MRVSASRVMALNRVESTITTLVATQVSADCAVYKVEGPSSRQAPIVSQAKTTA